MKIDSVNNSPEIHRLTNSIAGLVLTVTEIINAKVKEANVAQALRMQYCRNQPASRLPSKGGSARRKWQNTSRLAFAPQTIG